MEGTSSFAQVGGARSGSWRNVVGGALEGAAASVPLSLGCATLVFSRIGPEAIAAGLCATMLALAWTQLATAWHARPVMFNARIFEATTLAAMIDQVIAQLPAWGLQDTTGVRLAFLCAITGGAGVFVGLLYLARAERLTPFIPAPVFAGFSNSIAVALLVSQSRSLWELVTGSFAAIAVLAIAAAAFVATYAVRLWRPRWPSLAIGLAVGLVAALIGARYGQGTPMVSAGAVALTLPLLQADFRAWGAPDVRVWPMALLIAGNAAILGTMVFINTAMAAQALTQIDGRRPRGRGDGFATGAVLAASGFAGSAPLSGGIMTCLAVARTSRVAWPTMGLVGLLVLATYLSGLLGWIPLAAVAGALLCDGWFMADRPSLRLAVQWLRGTRLPDNAREDLALIAAVTALAVVGNMVIAALAGLVLGLFLFAVRSARQPVRHVWTGRQVSSNCARASSELRLLAHHGEEIRVFELEGDMFFAVGASLEDSLHAGSAGAACIVLDWSRVRHVDTSVAMTVAAFEGMASQRGIAVFHAAACTRRGNVAEELRQRLPQAQLAPDLDFALELAENRLIERHLDKSGSEASAVFEAMLLFHGLDPQESALLERAMVHRFHKRGDVIVEAGAPSEELMLILQGSASIVAPDGDGHKVRLAGVRRGAIIGEVGFLDGSPRSATVVAQDDVMLAVLTREKYDALSRDANGAVAKLLANLAVNLATRLRHTNRLAIARVRAHQSAAR